MKMRFTIILLLSAVLAISVAGCGIDTSLNSADDVADDGHEEGDELAGEEGHDEGDEHEEEGASTMITVTMPDSLP